MGKVVNVECALGDIFHRKTPKAFFFYFPPPDLQQYDRWDYDLCPISLQECTKKCVQKRKERKE